MLLNQQYLFTPGPTPIPERVKLAMNQPMIGHRGQAFAQLLEEVSTRLMPIFGSKDPVLVLTGSGTSALEAAAANIIEENDPVVVIVTGAFGERFATICETFGATVYRLTIPWGEICTPDQLENFLHAHKDCKAVFATYCETSTGVLNPIKELGAVTKRITDALFIVDGVSCIGAVPVDMAAWNIDILVSGSQKALMLPPGLAFIAVNHIARERIQSCSSKRFYLDLNRYFASYDKEKSTPFTPAVSLIAGALEVCYMIEEEGLEQVIQRHQLLKTMVREGIKALELPLLVSDEHASPTVTSVKPLNGKANQIKKTLQDKYSITIAGGQKKLKGEIFRIGHMGYCTPFDILKVLTGLEMTIHTIEGRNVLGQATKKAEEVWREYV
ncbi:alanine--glyoxylate aminotransferase family protein [Heyndrickxia oleronia]|uniref:Class V aminotransferase n=1 Tax=Heyndrickxia oleronia TaxID=38875 RepID=A0A8E2I9I2_9BACI|nr:alanine--glyoxylate aminotransferase family protein [Heyndrickxia oleronia]MEC1373074.1 alanine--glyoxylate aminotransferase family protein [Heyndrickxia oleronia]OOP68802.1 class V aminotransferase [Heyndrickxia oleronia]QQZ03947.1 alanine--glyoxylate aminotransferase family protein [Heyndrickxia oleronia]